MGEGKEAHSFQIFNLKSEFGNLQFHAA